jgi:hypothetical protein
MSQSSYKALSQTEARNETLDDRISLTETSDEGTTTSQDSLDLVLLEIGHKRKVRRKRRKAKMGGIHNFDGAESYEVSLIDSLPIPKPVPMPRDISTRAKNTETTQQSRVEWEITETISCLASKKRKTTFTFDREKAKR